MHRQSYRLVFQALAWNVPGMGQPFVSRERIWDVGGYDGNDYNHEQARRKRTESWR
jgi:hypothetical protein